MDTDDSEGIKLLEPPNGSGSTTPENPPSEILKRKIEFDLREMEIDDLPQVFHLGEQLFTAHEVPTLYRTWDEYEVTSLFNSDSEYCLVAEYEGILIGFVLGTTVSKKKSAWKYGYLVWLGVMPLYQRHGIAGRLFDKLAEKMVADGVRIFLVDTQSSDVAALQFFKKKGFGNPEPHIYLTLNLKTHQQLQKKNRNGNRKEKNGNGH